MNKLISGILQDPKLIPIIREKLPFAFETVDKEIKGNPAVGILRENAIIGMLTVFLGENSVHPADRAMQPDMDCFVGGKPLQIKTITGGAGCETGIRLKWTANEASANDSMDSYRPAADILIARISWEQNGYLRYVPIEVQEEVWAKLGKDYLSYSGGNTRGFNLSRKAVSGIDLHPNILTLSIHWSRAGVVSDAYERWINYWQQ